MLKKKKLESVQRFLHGLYCCLKQRWGWKQQQGANCENKEKLNRRNTIVAEILIIRWKQKTASTNTELDSATFNYFSNRKLDITFTY